MKLSILKKLALLLAGMATVQAQAVVTNFETSDGSSYYSLTDNYCTSVYQCLFVSRMPADIAGFDFYPATNKLVIDDRNVDISEGVTRYYTVRAFKKNDQTTFWRMKSPGSDIAHIDYGTFDVDAKVATSTAIKDIVLEASYFGYNSFDLTEFINELKMGTNAEVRLALAELQYYNESFGKNEDYPYIASHKTFYFRDNVTYSAFVDVKFPFISITSENANVEVPSEGSSIISVNLHGYAPVSYELQKMESGTMEWTSVSQGLISAENLKSDYKLKYTVNWKSALPVKYRWKFTQNGEEFYSDIFNVSFALPNYNIKSTSGGSVSVESRKNDNVVIIKATSIDKDKYLFTGWLNANNQTDTLSFDATYEYDENVMPDIVASFADVDTMTTWHDYLFKFYFTLEGTPYSGGPLLYPTSDDPDITLYTGDNPWWYTVDTECTLADYENNTNGCANGTTTSNMDTEIRAGVNFFFLKAIFLISKTSSKKFSSSPTTRVYINGEKVDVAWTIGETGIVGQKNYDNPTYEITFFDENHLLVDSKNLKTGTVPEAPVLEDDECIYISKWSPELAPVSGSQSYQKVSSERILKDNGLYLSVSNVSDGQHLVVETPSKCVNAFAYLIKDEVNNTTLAYEEGVDVASQVTLVGGTKYMIGLNTALNVTDEECLEDPYIKSVQYHGKDVKVYVNDVYAGDVVGVSEGKYSADGANTTIIADCGAITFASDLSSATIDGMSNKAVSVSADVSVSGEVVLKRDFSSGKFATVVLPVNVDAENIKGAKFYEFVNVVDNVVEVEETDFINAHTPYLVVTETDMTSLVIADGVKLKATNKMKSSVHNNWQFVGTYEYKKWTEGDPELGRAFVIDEMGKLKKIKVGDEQYPLSAYLVDINARVVTFFDDKGVQVGDVVTVASGMAVSAPAEPAKREGYTFAGWFQKDAETAYDFSAAVNEDLELYGKWTVNKYEIAVVVNDSKMGSVKGAGTYEYGSEVELVATAADGYKFTNWEDDVKASATRKVVVKADAEYTANFEKIPESSASAEKTSSSSTKLSSSSAKSSSSTKPKSSSSKTEAIVATAVVPQFSLSVAGRNVQIAGARIGSAYAVLDMQGRVLATGRTASASMEIAVPRAGSYMVRVGSQTKRVNVK